MSAAPTFHLLTLGCKVNQYESQALREVWVAQGCAEAAEPAGAGVVVVNSCAVTAGALADLRQMVARVRRANPQARIIVTGCAAQAVRAEVEAIPSVDCIVPQADKAGLLAGLPLAAHRAAAASGAASARSSATGSAAREIKISVEGQAGPIPPGEGSEENKGTASPGSASAASLSPPRRGKRVYPAFTVSASPRARAQVKVQDGCSHGCAYCIVPLARGPAVSREPDAVLAECRCLLAGGWRELVLTGINLRQYRSNKLNFWGLLRFLERELAPEWAGRARLRLSSLDPGQVGGEALDTLAASRLACPHLHLSLQAGSPAVLRRMGRGHYHPEDVAGFVDRLRAAWPLFGLGADLLAGFPGESQEEFEETRRFLAALPLTWAHVFPFSPRPGTPAATRPGQVAQEEKKARAAALRRLANGGKAAFMKALVARPALAMVLEDETSGRGMCEYGADCRLTAIPAGAAARDLVAVRPVGLEQGALLAEPAPEEA